MADSPVQRYYRLQATVYNLTRWSFLHGRARAVGALGLSPQSTVLEIGCGTGLNFRHIVPHLTSDDARLVGVDFSADMLQRAERLVERKGWKNIELVQADATKLDLKQKFSRVFFCYSIAMIPDWQRALERAVEHLEDGGRLVVLEFGQFEKWGLLGRPIRRWLRVNHVETEQPIKHELKSHFQQIDFSSWMGGYNFVAVGTK